jgi:hypothetical protein
MRETPNASRPASAAWLGYGGLVPFVGLAVLVALDGARQAFWSQALVAYGAVILSFVGALHWAFAMLLPGLSDAQRRHRFVWSTVPALLAWPALWLPAAWAVALLVPGLVLHYDQDRRLVATAGSALPAWYLPLRLQLTTVACASLALAALITAG